MGLMVIGEDELSGVFSMQSLAKFTRVVEFFLDPLWHGLPEGTIAARGKG